MILREQANFEKKLLTFFNFFMFLLTVGRSFLKVSQISLFCISHLPEWRNLKTSPTKKIRRLYLKKEFFS
jgi:hypothetical protein